MVIIILCGATCFTGVFLGIGGADVVTDFVMGLGLGKWGTFWVMMAIVFLLGMFSDWIGIVLICFPHFLPIAKQFGFDPIWFAIMMAVNLQASFLTPPFGYALFYIKGVDPRRNRYQKGVPGHCALCGVDGDRSSDMCGIPGCNYVAARPHC